MKNKGFTLVEILAVIVILSLLMVVAIPASQGIGKKVKEKLYTSKLTLAEKSAALWAEDNQNCFTCTESACVDDCTKLFCHTELENKKICEISLGSLAEDKYFKYDDETKKTIEDPRNKNLLLNDEIITVIYNRKTKTIITSSDPFLIPENPTEPIDPIPIPEDPNEPIDPVIVTKNLKETILAQYGGKTSIIEAPVSLFSSINTDNESAMYKMEDDYGMSYYYRGAKNSINNNLIFAGYQWKIVRINGNESIKIIYNGTCPNDICTINSTGESTQMGTSPFNVYDNDNKYVGYMYGGLAGTASTSRVQTTTNQTNSTIKTYLDAWYTSNILGTQYESYITDTIFCNDRRLRSEIGGPATGTGFGLSFTNYAAYHRLYTNKTPNLKCGLKNDRFTVSDTTLGNGALTYPIGLINPDEANIAGIRNGLNNPTNYLYTNQVAWTMGTSFLSADGHAYTFHVNSNGYLNHGYVIHALGVRGSLNIHSGTRVTGSGSTVDPFKVVSLIQ